MRITNINNTNFQSRNAKIRHADTLVRKINKEIPTASMNKYAHFYQASNFVYKDFFINLDDKFYDNVRGPLESVVSDSNALEYLKTAIDCLKNTPYANCSELVDIAQIIFAMNGIKTYKSTLEPGIDHVCLVMHKDSSKELRDVSYACAQKDARALHDIIVVDPWLNFVDFAPNANLKYKKEFLKFIEDPVIRELSLPIKLKKLPEIYFSPFIEPNLLVTPTMRKELREVFPNLVINK